MRVWSLQKTAPMRRVRQRGFTMIELMIVVVIVGILASVAVVAYRRHINKVRAGEVDALFQELKVKEEGYAAEFGRYLGVCSAALPAPGVPDNLCTEGDYWPAPLTGNLIDITGAKPVRWTRLKVQPGKGALYCQYEVIAGPGGNISNMGAIGQSLYTEFPGSVPPKNWYYMLAQCDWDKDAAVNALYWSRGDQSAIGKENEQR